MIAGPKRLNKGQGSITMGKNVVSISDGQLAEYLALGQEMKRLEKARAAIKSQIEALGGNFETDQFTVTTTQYETNRVCDAETLLLKVGFVKCNELGLINTSTAKRLNVERKESKAA